MEAKKGESWRRETSFLFSPSPSPTSNLLSPSPLGRPDTQATKAREKRPGDEVGRFDTLINAMNFSDYFNFLQPNF